MIGDDRQEHGNLSALRDGVRERKNFVREWFTRHAPIASVSEAKRLRELEVENARLKKLLAEAMLENEVTREALRKKW